MYCNHKIKSMAVECGSKVPEKYILLLVTVEGQLNSFLSDSCAMTLITVARIAIIFQLAAY